MRAKSASAFAGCGIAALVASTLLSGGCLTSRLEELKNSATGIAAGESLVILATSYHKGQTVEEGFVSCVRDEVSSGKGALPVYSEQQFADDLFPWFEPRTAPQAASALPALLARPGVKERIQARGVRYLVWLNGSTERVNSGGTMSCAIGVGIAGCLGLGWWEDESKYDAAVWDLSTRTDAGTVSANVQGTSMVPAIVVPIPIIARTKAAACKDIARQIATFIRNPGPAA